MINKILDYDFNITFKDEKIRFYRKWNKIANIIIV